jgi:hypothetical protein
MLALAPALAPVLGREGDGEAFDRDGGRGGAR